MTNLNGENVTDSVLNDKNYSFWIIMYDLKLTDDDQTLMAKINDFCKLAGQDKEKVLAFTASNASEIDGFKKKNNASYQFVTADAIVLKTMVRSNPGLMLIKNGKVMMNWHHNNFPTFSDVKQKYMK